MPDRCWAKPITAVIEPSETCSLNCRFCPTGRRRKEREPVLMSPKTFKLAAEPLVDCLYEAYLYNWGEPFDNPTIWEYIKFMSDRKVKTIVSTNLNLPGKGDVESIIKSGLDTLIVSIDGTTEETYRLYRSGGDFGRTMETLKSIIKEKRINNLKRPFIIWQFVVFSHNEHQIDEAIDLAKQIGVDQITFLPTSPHMEKEIFNTEQQRISEVTGILPKDERFHLYTGSRGEGKLRRRSDCTMLWDGITIRTDGGVAPCCSSYFARYDFGNVHNEHILEIWNNQKYQESRRTQRTTGRYKSNTVCNICNQNNPQIWY
jgi:radical SAM protein with 4Fe4S-binding SPASM domain